jgi:hypothetical protein
MGRQLMSNQSIQKRSMKKIIIVFSLLVVMIIITIIYIFNFSSFYYNSNWIIGRNYEQTVNRYGGFYFIVGDKNHDFFGFSGFYEHETFFERIERIFFGTDSRYYRIDFDSSGMAINIYKSGYPGG